jgi:2-phosphosulfolactate phosphatase
LRTIDILDGRKDEIDRDGLKIVVDVFRSTTTIPIILKNGAEKIIPTGTVKKARSLSRSHPDYVLAGERYGFKVPGFDLGNSPADVWNIDFSGKTVIFTSTNGTKIISRLKDRTILLSSFVNCSATVNYVGDTEKIVIITSGRPDGYADEDFIYAEYLKEKLSGNTPDDEFYRKTILNSSGAKRLSMIGFSRDIDYCIMIDSVKFAVKVEDGIITRSQ